MIDERIEKILGEIFSHNSGWDSGELIKVQMCPGFNDIKAFASLLSTDPREEQLQQFLENQPQFLLGLFGQGTDIAFISKPSVGTRYRADFAMLNVGQGGCSISLIEIEKSSEKLFTAKGTPARTLQSAIGQVEDWHQWITTDGNQQTFVRDILDIAKHLPLSPDCAENKSFRLRPSESIEQFWRAFKGYERPKILYAIIAGRWALLPEEHQQRLIFKNTQGSSIYKIYTYDEVARHAYSRLLRRW